MKRYFLIISIFLVIISAVIYLGISAGYTQHYDDREISFDYPQDWSTKPGSNPSQVVLFQPSSNSNITINKQIIPPGYQPPENYILNTTEAYNSGFRLISHKVRKLNMDDAYENTYQFNSHGNTYLQKEVWISKNGNLYSIIYTQKETSADFLSNSQHGFETIVRNFKVETVLVPAETPFWGDVSIPAIDVDWGIRRDTVNGYDSVFHYEESFYPGQNGTMGLLGHHTLYSAPFAHIDQLKAGDEVIINDYLTQRKYIYQVVSNGDIKWDYQTDPIKFPQGDNNLTLVTCYPPGTTQAAWMVHCKLISIETLN